MFSTTYAEVVSVARPGSSDGGSLPIATRRVPPDAVPEVPVVVPLLLPPPPQPAATRARPSTAARARGRASVVRIASSLPMYVRLLRLSRSGVTRNGYTVIPRGFAPC